MVKFRHFLERCGLRWKKTPKKADRRALRPQKRVQSIENLNSMVDRADQLEIDAKSQASSSSYNNADNLEIDLDEASSPSWIDIDEDIQISKETNQPTIRCKRADKLKDYYPVKAIIGHKEYGKPAILKGEILDESEVQESGDERLFLVDWDGFEGEETWEYESNLNKCILTLKKYLKDNNLEPTKVKHYAGASSFAKTNPENWIEIDTIMSFIQIYRKTLKINVNINIELFKMIKKRDTIYIIEQDNHCFVILHLFEQKLCFIADGGNEFINNSKAKFELERRLRGLKLKPMQFTQQSGADHCGSSAIALALEFLRLYRDRETYLKFGWPQLITVSPGLLKTLRNRLHKKDSEKITTRNENTYKRPWYECPKCKARFQSSSKQPLSAHIKSCLAKE